jgi:hypothetical protein
MWIPAAPASLARRTAELAGPISVSAATRTITVAEDSALTAISTLL